MRQAAFYTHSEIWTCRLKTSNQTALQSDTGKTEAGLLANYLQRNHDFRSSNTPANDTGHVYSDDDWALWPWDDIDRDYLEEIFDPEDVTLTTETQTTCADDYKNNFLTAGYRLAILRSHGTALWHGFWKVEGSPPRNTFRSVHSSDYRQIDPEIQFWDFFVCDGCDYTISDNLAGTIAFNSDGNGFVVWGETKTGGFDGAPYLYACLGDGGSVGDAFVSALTNCYWWRYDYEYGAVVIGDATLKVFPTETTEEELVFHIKDGANGVPMITIDADGDILASGSLTQNATSQQLTPQSGDAWIVRNDSGNVVSRLDANADLFIDGALYENQGSMTPGNAPFRLKNSSGAYIMYIDTSGNLKLKGYLYMGGS
jgi:hypothetical protein